MDQILILLASVVSLGDLDKLLIVLASVVSLGDLDQLLILLASVGSPGDLDQLLILLASVGSPGGLDQQDLTRFAIHAKGPDGKWTRKPLAYRESNNVHLLITRPPEICVNLVFKHVHAASSYTICRQFVPFIYCPV